MHSFLVEIYPSNSDWDYIVNLTGDSSWNPANMRKYFERFEQCRYVAPQPGNPSGHGFNGWQPSEIPDGRAIFGSDPNINRYLQSAEQELGTPGIIDPLLDSQLDPNDQRVTDSRRR